MGAMDIENLLYYFYHLKKCCLNTKSRLKPLVMVPLLLLLMVIFPTVAIWYHKSNCPYIHTHR